MTESTISESLALDLVAVLNGRLASLDIDEVRDDIDAILDDFDTPDSIYEILGAIRAYL